MSGREFYVEGIIVTTTDMLLMWQSQANILNIYSRSLHGRQVILGTPSIVVKNKKQ